MNQLRFWRRLRADRAGSAAAEFALITPLMSMMLFSTVEMGSLLYSYSAMQMAASQATRQIAVNAVTPSSMPGAVTARLPGWAAQDVAVTVTQSHPNDPGLNNIDVTVSAQADRLAAIALITRLVPWTMTTRVTIKQELPYVD